MGSPLGQYGAGWQYGPQLFRASIARLVVGVWQFVVVVATLFASNLDSLVPTAALPFVVAKIEWNSSFICGRAIVLGLDRRQDGERS